jgi:outer membrane protein assembly factor BamB
MSRRSVALVAFLITIGFGGSLFAQQAGLPSDVMLGRLGLQRAWWAHASLDPMQDRVQHFLADEQVTVVQSVTGMVTTFDNTNGHRLWAVQVGDPHELRFPAVTNDHLVVINSGTSMYGLAKKTGDVAWQVQIPTAVSTAPGLDDTRVYVGSVTGAIYAYDLKFLDKLSKDPRLLKDIHRSLKWQYKTGARIIYQPVSTGTIVVIASADASLYGMAAKDRKIRFQFETDQPLSAPIGQFGRLILVATGDRKAYCLDAETGAIKWELLAGLSIRQVPRVIDDHVFLRPEGYGLRCIALADGTAVWSNRQAVAFLAATPTAVYASDSLGNVLLLNQKDGRQIGAFSMRAYPIRVSNDRTDRLYFASPRGMVVCIRESDRNFPLFHHAPEKQPVLPDVAPDDKGAKPPAATKKPAAGQKKKGEDEDPAMEEKKESTETTPAADENAEKPAAKPAPGKSGKPTKPADSEN